MACVNCHWFLSLYREKDYSEVSFKENFDNQRASNAYIAHCLGLELAHSLEIVSHNTYRCGIKACTYCTAVFMAENKRGQWRIRVAPGTKYCLVNYHKDDL